MDEVGDEHPEPVIDVVSLPEEEPPEEEPRETMTIAADEVGDLSDILAPPPPAPQPPAQEALRFVELSSIVLDISGMKRSTLDRALRSARDGGATRNTEVFFLGGEPLRHPAFERMVKLVMRLGYRQLVVCTSLDCSQDVIRSISLDMSWRGLELWAKSPRPTDDEDLRERFGRKVKKLKKRLGDRLVMRAPELSDSECSVRNAFVSAEGMVSLCLHCRDQYHNMWGVFGKGFLARAEFLGKIEKKIGKGGLPRFCRDCDCRGSFWRLMQGKE